MPVRQSLFRRAVFAIKSFSLQTFQTSSWYVGVEASWLAGATYEKMVALAYTNPYAFRSIKIIADSVADIDVHLHRNVDGETEEVEDHEYIEFMRKPNGVDSYRAWIRKITVFGLVHGNAYLWLRGSGPFHNEDGTPTGRRPQTIEILRPDWVSVNKRDEITDKIVEYLYTNRRGKPVEIPADEIVHIKQFNPLNMDLGYPPLAAAFESLQLMKAAKDWNKSIYDNKGRIPGVVNFTGEQPMGRELLARTQDKLHEAYDRASKLSKPWLLNKHMSFDATAITQTDAETLDWNRQFAREISVALGVDPSLLGDSENKTYSNFEAALRALYILTVIPETTMYLDEFTCHLLPLWDTDPDLSLGFERAQIEALQEDQTAMYERLTRAIGRPWLSVDDGRTEAGFDTVGDDDIPVPASLNGDLFGPTNEDETDDDTATDLANLATIQRLVANGRRRN